MKNIIYSLVLLLIFSSCSQNKHEIFTNTMIPMPEEYRQVTGCDSIQLVYDGRAKYNEAKQDYDVTWDSLTANFCYPNQWSSSPFKRLPRKKPDTSHSGFIRFTPKIQE